MCVRLMTHTILLFSLLHEDVGRGWIASGHCGWVWRISIQSSKPSRSLITRSVLMVYPATLFTSVCCKGVVTESRFYIHSQNLSQPLELEFHLLTISTSLALHKMFSFLIWSHLGWHGGTSYGMFSKTFSSSSGWWTLSLLHTTVQTWPEFQTHTHTQNTHTHTHTVHRKIKRTHIDNHAMIMIYIVCVQWSIAWHSYILHCDDAAVCQAGIT